MTPHDLLANFETLAEAPNGIQRLRELVLELAVRGKLVEQDPEDGSAQDLIEELCKGGKTKRASGLNDAGFSLFPFDLPRNWAWTRFDQVASIDSNLVNPLDYPTSSHVAPDNIEKNTGKLLTYRTVAEDGVRSNNHLFHAGHILYSKIRPNLSKVVVVDFPGLCSADMYPLSTGLDRGYFHRFLLSVPFLAQVTTGDNRVAMPKVNQQQLSAVLVPVPPLREQRRIVARVDELMALLDSLDAKRQKREAARTAARDSALAALREAPTPDDVETAWLRIQERFYELFATPEDVEPLRTLVLELAVRGHLVEQDSGDEPANLLLNRVKTKKPKFPGFGRQGQSLIADALEKPFDLPQGWAWARMEDFCDIKSGVTKGRNLQGIECKEYPYLRVANVQAGYTDLGVMKTIPLPVMELDSYRLVKGDVLLTEGGDWDKLGRSAVWTGEIDPCIHQNHVFRARCLDQGIRPRWISSFTNSPDGRTYFQSCSKQTTNLASINMTQLKACLVPLPPSTEQDRILARMDDLMAQLDGVSKALGDHLDMASAFAAAAVHHLEA